MSENPIKSRDRSHGRTYRYWDKLPAWRTLDSRGRDLVMFVLRAYHPDMPNAFALSDGNISALLDCSENTARRVVRACIERGWFCLERAGGTDGAPCVRSRVISLTKYETATRRAEPQRYENWRPLEISTAQNMPFVLSPFSGERRRKKDRTAQKSRSKPGAAR